MTSARMFKDRRDAVLSYFRTKEPLDFEGLRIRTGLGACELRVILNDLVNSREVRRIEDKYKRVEIGRRLRSWQLRGYDPNKVLTVDVETTGLDRSYDDVLQLAIVEYDEDVRLNGFYGSSRHDWREATQVNGITPAMVDGLLTLGERANDVSDLLSDASVIVGYNLAFDQSFMKAAGVRIPGEVFCCDVMLDVRDMLHNMSLSKACGVFEVIALPAHDAINDSINTIRLSKAIMSVVL